MQLFQQRAAAVRPNFAVTSENEAAIQAIPGVAGVTWLIANRRWRWVFVNYLALALFFWALRDWLLGKSPAEERAQRAGCLHRFVDARGPRGLRYYRSHDVRGAGAPVARGANSLRAVVGYLDAYDLCR